MTSLTFVGPTFFYSRELFNEVGGFSEKYKNAEEWPFVYKIIMRGNRIYAINKKLVRYRFQNSSLCHFRDEKQLVNKQLFMSNYQHYFEHSIKDLISDGRPLTAWHYTLSYWGKRIQYKVKGTWKRRVLLKCVLLFSPMSYLHKLGIDDII